MAYPALIPRDLEEKSDIPISSPTPITIALPSIVKVIETVQRLKDAYCPITQDERTLIAMWPGWGPYAPAFESNPSEKWETVGPQIRMLLGKEGYESASAATPTSFFTSSYISQGIWQIATQLGFSGGSVLEPGCGTGQVLSACPSRLVEEDRLMMTGIEREPFTASVAQLLFPKAHIITSSLQEVALTEGAFDLVVGNVPFADVGIYDRTLVPIIGKRRLSLHNYFIYRSLAALRPGGLAILVTSRYTMDAQDTHARDAISQLGFLLGAIRLPSSGHKWARTEVITDILVLQRRYSHASWYGHDFVAQEKLAIDGIEILTSSYFANHPQQILGTATLEHGMYRNDELKIRAPLDLESAFDEAITRITREASHKKSTYIPRLDLTRLDDLSVAQHIREDGLKEGCFYLLGDGLGLVQIVNGQPKAVTKMIAELSALVGLRDATLALLEAERDHTRKDLSLIGLRSTLNHLYDAYVSKYGFLRRSTIIKRVDKDTGEEKPDSRRLPMVMYAFRTDEHYPLILGLEVYDDETQRAEKAAIFRQRVNHPAVYKQTADSPAEAIALSLDQRGVIDFPFIARVAGLSFSSFKHDEERDAPVITYLGDLAYCDPETKGWVITPQYLSGNVRKKLEIAQIALRDDPRWQRNVEALEKVQPEPLSPENIKVLLGAPWVPVEYIIQFCEELLRMKPEIKRDKTTGTWDVVAPYGGAYSARVTSTWGTSRVSAFRLIEHLLNHKSTTVEDEQADGKMRVNTEDTLAANQKKKEIQVRFGEWIWEDNERTKVLAALYNKLYNGMVSQSFNGDHLTFPGMDPFWQENLYSWQRDFIARMINTPSGLCAYPVGAGKTKIQVAGAMTLRRMQLITKAAILVPNHLLEQIAAEAKQLYPSANILMISRDDLSRENRRIFMARIATGDHDVIVMTHSAFESIGVHPATKAEYIQRRLAEYRQVLMSIPDNGDRADTRKIKRIEKLMDRMEENLKQLMDVPHDGGITFEQLGISYIICDEFHFFKNLGLPTNQDKLQVTPSQRAQDMLMKLRYLEKKNVSVSFASGFTATPISNSMVEAFVVLWYLNVNLLKEYELYCVDDFASMFIETENKIEVTPTGAGFRMYERPSNFINLPEFMHLFASVADIRSPDILADKRPDVLEHTIPVEPTDEVVTYVNYLLERSEKLHQNAPMEIHGKEDNMLWVTTDGRKAALSMLLHGIREEYPAKLDSIAIEMARVYHRWQEKASYLPGTYKSFQIGFCDIGTPSKEKGDQVYGEIKRLLIQKGVPAQGIRFIHDAQKSDTAKAMLFEQCRSGEVAILLGSTQKLGTGVNIQTRCAAIHHCDAPWRPDEVEQRTGRGQRPGNLYPVVEVFYYVQRRTFDAYSWQILANKARPFNQMRSTQAISREMSYSDDSTLTYGQVKAAATGDILLLEHANMTLSADAFSRLYNSFVRARQRDMQEAESLQSEARYSQEYLKQYAAMQAVMNRYEGKHPFMTPDRFVFEKKEERAAFVAEAIGTAIKNPYATYHKLGYYMGVSVFFKVNFMSTTPYVLAFYDPSGGIEVPCAPTWMEKDNQWRFMWKIEQFFESLLAEITRREERILSKRKKADEFEEQSKSVFPDMGKWQEIMARLTKLNAYIDFAASAKSEEALGKLAVIRQELLDTAPQEMVERPRAKNTAMFVLSPRNPFIDPSVVIDTTIVRESQLEERIEVTVEGAREQTIAEVARTIQQSTIIGSKATVAFGLLSDIELGRKKAKRKANKGDKKDVGEEKQVTWTSLW